MGVPRSYSSKEVQTILGCGKTKFWEMIRDGEFPNAFKVGRSVRVPEEDVVAYRVNNKVSSMEDGVSFG